MLAIEKTTEKTHEGYWKDARGALIPESMIKPIDKERDALVKQLVEKSQEVNDILRALKNQAFADIEAFIDLSAEEYGVILGGRKGNITLYTFDGEYKIQIAKQDRLAFDERLHAAKALVDECLHDWTDGARPELKAIIERAFSTNKEGELNTGRILELRRLDIKDERWQRAMDAIGDAIQIIGSRSYFRVYKRVGNTDSYQVLSLDIAGV